MSQEVFVVTLRYSPLVHLVSFAYLKEGAFFFVLEGLKQSKYFDLSGKLESTLRKC